MLDAVRVYQLRTRGTKGASDVECILKEVVFDDPPQKTPLVFAHARVERDGHSRVKTAKGICRLLGRFFRGVGSPRRSLSGRRHGCPTLRDLVSFKPPEDKTMELHLLT